MSKTLTRFLEESETPHKIPHDIRGVVAGLGKITHHEHFDGKGPHYVSVSPKKNHTVSSLKAHLQKHGFQEGESQHDELDYEPEHGVRFHFEHPHTDQTAMIHSHFDHATGKHTLRVDLNN